MRPLSARILAVGTAGLLLGGCASQPPPPSDMDRIEQMIRSFSALSQTLQAAKRTEAIRQDTSVLFPARAQAIALGLLSYRAEIKAWPATKKELHAFLEKRFGPAIPSEDDMSDLLFETTSDDAIRFSFVREKLKPELYLLGKDGTISFPLTSIALRPPPESGQSPGNPDIWNDLAARLFVELPLRLLLAPR